MVLASKRRANDAYDSKTYKRVAVVLRLDDDADILAELEEAKEQGCTLRGYLRSLHDGNTGGYTKEQIIKAFDGFRGTLYPELIERKLEEVE